MYDEIVPFFGTDKARLFVALNYNDGDNYSHAINEGNPDALLDEPLWQLMIAKNYVNGGRALWQQQLPVAGPGVVQAVPEDLEIAGQFFDFISTIAQQHALIDGVTRRTVLPVAGPGSRSRVDMNDLRKTGTGDPRLPSNRLYQQIYTNFASLDESTRQFYQQHLNIVDVVGNVVPQKTAGVQARLNLLKVDPRNNQSTVVFQQTLPLLPTGSFYINNTGVKQVVNSTDIRDHYRDEYLGNNGIAGVLQRGGAGLADFFPDWAASLTNQNGLNVSKFTAALVYATNKRVQAQASGRVAGDLDGIYDLVTGNLYSVDAQGNLVKDNHVVDAASYAADIAANNVECYGTNLQDCDKVFECLLSGDPKKLGRCLGKLRKANMAQIAGKELKDMHPEVALKLLRTFNIELKKDQYGNHVPMEFLEWRATLDARVGVDAAAAIKQNKQLLEYLRAVVQLVRTNPEIIAANRQKQVQQRTNQVPSSFTPPRPFVAPSKRSAPASSMLLRTVPFITNQLAMPQPPLLPPGIAGFGYGPVAPFPLGFLSGGASQSDLTDSAQSLQSTYEAVLKDLQNSGKDLVDADKNLIENAIKRVSKNQKQIEHALNELNAFNKLSVSLKAGLPQALELKDVDGASRMVNLDKTVSNLQSNVSSVARENQALITQLYNNVFKSLASLRLGQPSSNLVAITH